MTVEVGKSYIFKSGSDRYFNACRSFDAGHFYSCEELVRLKDLDDCEVEVISDWPIVISYQLAQYQLGEDHVYVLIEAEAPCPIATKVAESIIERSKFGMKKYGVNADRGDLSLLEWIIHAQDEAKDFCIYLEKMKKEVEILEQANKSLTEENSRLEIEGRFNLTPFITTIKVQPARVESII